MRSCFTEICEEIKDHNIREILVCWTHHVACHQLSLSLLKSFISLKNEMRRGARFGMDPADGFRNH